MLYRPCASAAVHDTDAGRVPLLARLGHCLPLSERNGSKPSLLNHAHCMEHHGGDTVLLLCGQSRLRPRSWLFDLAEVQHVLRTLPSWNLKRVLARVQRYRASEEVGSRVRVGFARSVICVRAWSVYPVHAHDGTTQESHAWNQGGEEGAMR